MAISLNNHETRIKALETQGGAKIIKVLASNTGNTCNLSESAKNFDLIEIQANNTYYPARKVITILLASNIVVGQAFNIGSCSDGDNNDYATAKFNSETQLVYANAKNHSGFWRVTGLKLYYNFSYNIIIKIILRIISSLIQKVAKSIPNFILKGGVGFGYFC